MCFNNGQSNQLGKGPERDPSQHFLRKLLLFQELHKSDIHDIIYDLNLVRCNKTSLTFSQCT